MRLIKWIKDRRQSYKQHLAKRDQSSYQIGFEWAMSSYYLHGVSVEAIKAYTFDSKDAFDQGANRALLIIELKPNKGDIN